MHKNCENQSFGHYDYALELFDFFMALLEAKQELIKNYSQIELEEYENTQKDFENRYWEYKKEFYLNIHESSGKFGENEIYKLHEKLRE